MKPARELRFPLHAWSVVFALVCDWLLFAANLLTQLDALAAIVLMGATTAGASVFLIEHLRADRPWKNSLVRALLVAVAVAAPLPLLGTFLATAALSFALARTVSRTYDKQRSDKGVAV